LEILEVCNEIGLGKELVRSEMVKIPWVGETLDKLWG